MQIKPVQTSEPSATDEPRRKVVIVGASARAAADSAFRAGFDPFCVDLFNDRDLRAPSLLCPMSDYPEAIPRLLKDAPKAWNRAPAILTGAMENHPDTLRAIAAQRPLSFASVEAMAKSRDPRLWQSLPGIAGVQPCAARLPGIAISDLAEQTRWLFKPLRSSAGHGIRFFDAARSAVPDSHYLQEFVAGRPVSAVFHATARGAVLLGVTRQIIGDPAFGARDFQYVGNLGPLREPALQASFHALGEAVALHSGLRGVFGIDAIVDEQGLLRPLEVNPRFPSSAEVLELAGVRSVLLAPGLDDIVSQSAVCAGKAVVYARAAARVPDLFEYFKREEIADVPQIGDVIPTGRPICTVRASASDATTCLQRLHILTDELYTRLGS